MHAAKNSIKLSPGPTSTWDIAEAEASLSAELSLILSSY